MYDTRRLTRLTLYYTRTILDVTEETTGESVLLYLETITQRRYIYT
jgi:hypothetical protein